MNERKTWVNKRPAHMSLRSACAVLGVNRSQQYYQPSISADKENLEVTLMNEIQDIYALRPFLGYKRMRQELKDMGWISYQSQTGLSIDATDGITGGVSQTESQQATVRRYCTSVFVKATPPSTGARLLVRGYNVY